MPNVIYTVRPDGLLREADSIERSAKESQKSWIMLGQLDKYSNAMQEANLLRRAAAEKSVYTRREILRNAGYTVKTPKALSKNPKTRNSEGATMATKKFSPAQIAAQKLFAERARAGTLNKRKKRKPNPGLYENINAKRKRIAAGSGEKMRKPGQAGRPTAEAFEQSAMTAKRKANPDNSNKPMAAQGFVSYRYKGRYGFIMIGARDDKDALNEARRSTRDAVSLENLEVWNGKKYEFVISPKYNEEAVDKVIASSRSKISASEAKTIKRLLMGRSGNPDKSKPRAYVMRASQATGRPPVKGTKAGNRLITRRKKALSAPAGYFPNPKAAAMMTGYQVICMHPKKHVVGIFKTMAEAKMVATAMANAKGVPYGVKAVKVHKAHFAA